MFMPGSSIRMRLVQGARMTFVLDFNRGTIRAQTEMCKTVSRRGSLKEAAAESTGPAALLPTPNFDRK